MSDIFAVIADSHRRQILAALATKPQTVSDLVMLTKLEQPTVSKHLKALRDANLVDVTAAGQTRIYQATLAPLREVADYLEAIRVETSEDAATTKAVQDVINDAGEVVGNWLAAGATWLGGQLQAKLAEADIDAKQLGRELGRKLADAKSDATDYATGKEAELRKEIQAAVSKVEAKVRSVTGAATKPAAKPATKPAARPASRSATKPAAKKVSTNTTVVRTVSRAVENEDEF